MDRNRKTVVRRTARHTAALVLENYLEVDADVIFDDVEEQEELRQEIRRIAGRLHQQSAGHAA
jgi:hypothetical protein